MTDFDAHLSGYGDIRFRTLNGESVESAVASAVMHESGLLRVEQRVSRGSREGEKWERAVIFVQQYAILRAVHEPSDRRSTDG